MDPIQKLARRLRGVERLAFKAATQPQLAYSSIEDGAIQSVVDGSLKAIIGKQFDGTQAIAIVNGPPPPQPSAPGAAAAIEGAVLSWDGTFVGDAIVPMDFARVEVHVSTDPDFTAEFAATLKATFETPRGGEVFVSLVPATYYVKLVARNSSGGRSLVSTATTVIPTAIEDVVLAPSSDGSPPASSPAATVDGGIGSLFITWPEVTNADQVTYDVHLDDTTGFTPDSTNLLGSTTGTGPLVARILPGGGPLVAGTTYYARIVARDADGAAAPGAEDSGTPAQIISTDVATDAITSVKIPNDAITAAEIAAGAVGTVEIATDAITNDLIAANAVTATEIADGSIATPKLAAGAVTAAKIAADTITANEIAAGAISTAELAAGAVTAAKIAADTITANEIAANAITATEIAADAVTTSEILAGAVTADEIAANAVTTDKILANSITGDKIVANAITADKIAAGEVTAEKFEAVIALLTTILLGSSIELSAENGIVVDSPAGQTKLAPDGSGNTFAGQGTFDALTVLKDLGIYGTTNFLSGLLSLNKGVTDPLAMPIITSSYDYVDTGGYRLNPRGLTDDGSGPTGNWVITDNLAGATCNFQFWNKVTGIGGGAVDLVAGYEGWGGITRIGGYYYVLVCAAGTAGIGSSYRIHKYRCSDNAFIIASGVVLSGSASRPAIGTDGTNLLMAYNSSAGNQITIRTLDQNFVSNGVPTVLFSRTAAAGNWGSNDIMAVSGVVIGGSMRFIASSLGTHFAYDLTSSTVITRNTAYEWPAAAAGSVYGVWHDGTNFHMSTKGKFFDYSNLSGSWKFAYSWYDSDAGGSGTAETKVSTQKVITPTKYAKWTVTVPNSPPDDGTTDGANTAIIYAAPNDGSGLVRQTILAEGTLTQSYLTLATSGTAPQASNQFASRPGAVGNIASVAADAINNLITLKGDGSGRVGPLRWDANGKNIDAEQASGSTVTYSPTAAVAGQRVASLADLVFTAPASGRVMIMIGAYVLSKTAGQSAVIAPEVRTGSTIGAGTVVYANNFTNDGFGNYNTAYVHGWSTAVVDNLTPGATYNTYAYVSSSGSAGATWTLGHAKVIPLP